MPAERGKRLEVVDAIRGLALGGMLIANLGVFSGAALVPLARLGSLERFVSLISVLLVQGKFYPLFAFLFGWGLARQAETHTRNYQLRRLALLGLMGAAHSIFLWSGDILMSYALLGLVVISFGEWLYGKKWLLGMVIIISLLLSSFLSLPGIGEEIHGAFLNWSASLRQMVGQPGDIRTAPPATFPSASLDRLKVTFWKMIYFPDWLGNYLAIIFCGFLVGKKGWLERLLELPEIPLRRLAGWFLWVGLFLNGVYVSAKTGFWLGPQALKSFCTVLTESLGGVVLAGAYLLILVVVWQRAQSLVWLKRLANMGRMSLSNYVFQSLICGLLCYSYGLDLYGRIPITGILPLAAVIFLVQAVFCILWLGRFQVGPLEAIWRRAAGGGSATPPAVRAVPGDFQAALGGS